MMGGFTGCPVECSTGPGTPMPMAATSDADRPDSDSRTDAVSTSQVSTGSGPRAMSISPVFSDSTLPVRSAMATVPCEAPRSTATTTLAAGLIANCDGGRPPVETASATGVMSPMRISSSTRTATVDRARPVDLASSARVRGTPSRSNWNNWLTPLTDCTESVVILFTPSVHH